MAKKKRRKPSGVRVTVDETGNAASIVHKRLTKELHERLINETREMLDGGAVIEDVIWVLLPDGL